MPVEKRVIDSVRWAIKRFKIDPERVYLSGNSMGGSGALGIGMRHGNVFAAIKANVPAGVEHAAERLFFPPRTIPSGLVIPDPPICVNYSAQNDGWSVGHGEFFRAMENRRYALMLYWGPFGHANNSERIKTVNDLIDSFDWLSVRKDEAYPVFTRASGNSALPWPDNLKSKAAGQVNGFFRWKSREDTADALSVSLFLATRENLKTRFSIPEEVVADVSIRRIQDFRLSAGEKFHWEFGKIKGEGRVDEQGLITIPELRITGRPVTLRIQRGQKSEPVSRVPALRRQVEGKGWRLDRAQPENTGRPRVLLIGDSILSGYRKDVIKSLDGVAEVDTWVNPHWQSENTNALLADLLDKNGPYNVVHFNMGLHGWTEGRIKKGTFRPLTRSYVEVLKGKLPSARFIWASSTPVTRKGDTSSFDPEVNPVIVRHNMMAAEVMRDAGIPVSDFYALLAGRRDLAKGDRFHWTSPAYRLLGKTATSSILAALKGTAQGAAPKK